MKLTLTIPLKPPSVNTYVRHTRAGRHYVTKEVLAFKSAVAILSAGRTVAPVHKKDRAKVRYAIAVVVALGKGERLDADNCLKVIIDSLVDAQVIHTDSKVGDIKVKMIWDERGNPRTEIEASAVY